MGRKGTTYPGLVTAAIFILLEVAAVSMLRHSGRLQDIWISRASHRTIGALWGMGQDLSYYFSLKKENERLAEENFRLSTLLGSYRLEEEMEELSSECDGMKRYGGYSFTPTRIVKMSTNSQHNYIILDKGRADGILPDSGIITPNGVVGVVDAVGEHYCYGITLMNTGLAVSCRHLHSGTVAQLSWDGKSSRTALLKEMPLHCLIAEGDTVATSGFSAIFPADIPVGVVEGKKKTDGTSIDVKIRLLEDFSALKNVMVATNLAREEIAELEKER